MKFKVFERPFQFMLYPGDHQKIKELAKQKNVDMADIVRRALKQYLEEEFNETEREEL